MTTPSRPSIDEMNMALPSPAHRTQHMLDKVLTSWVDNPANPWGSLKLQALKKECNQHLQPSPKQPSHHVQLDQDTLLQIADDLHHDQDGQGPFEGISPHDLNWLRRQAIERSEHNPAWIKAAWWLMEHHRHADLNSLSKERTKDLVQTTWNALTTHHDPVVIFDALLASDLRLDNLFEAWGVNPDVSIPSLQDLVVFQTWMEYVDTPTPMAKAWLSKKAAINHMQELCKIVRHDLARTPWPSSMLAQVHQTRANLAANPSFIAWSNASLPSDIPSNIEYAVVVLLRECRKYPPDLATLIANQTLSSWMKNSKKSLDEYASSMIINTMLLQSTSLLGKDDAFDNNALMKQWIDRSNPALCLEDVDVFEDLVLPMIQNSKSYSQKTHQKLVDVFDDQPDRQQKVLEAILSKTMRALSSTEAIFETITPQSEQRYVEAFWSALGKACPTLKAVITKDVLQTTLASPSRPSKKRSKL